MKILFVLLLTVYKILVDLFLFFYPDLFRFDAKVFYGMSHVSIT